MSEDGRTLWVGNLDEKVTEALMYELFLQTGPIERLIFVTEGEGENKQHTGQVLDGSSLFAQQLMLKARSLPAVYKSSGNSATGDKGRFDNSSLRTGFNKATTWHGQSDLVPRGRGNFRGGRGGASNYNQNSGYNTGYNNYNQGNSNVWMSGQQASSDTQGAYATSDPSIEEKRQQSLQQGIANMATQMYTMVQQQRSQQQGMWTNTGDWTGTGGDTTVYTNYNSRSGW